MKFPLITRKRHERDIENVRGRTIVYEPVEYPVNEDGRKVIIPPDDFASLDARIGWVRRREFKDYSAYIEYLKEYTDQAALARAIK